ncbi:evolutionarily conserved signaling intermediate in Toll pathway, mitochondrial [Cylas formicarius]|uniref:evolutionarily conserved signaling intermediate in Toll pathway, mitochondrial n=1 Tax=Cylas formicarius TaxID=197179 RepID=UPI002958A04C|nr:evolutionarily conserved signaling intermediate in Toll pathway, mitochondrial [Cylas formicarius]
MILRKLLRCVVILSKCRTQSANVFSGAAQYVHTSVGYLEKADDKSLVVQDMFESVREKNKNTYLDMIRIYVNREHVYRRGHVEFIYAALKNMEEFGVHKDLEVYKSLIDVLPKGKLVAKNIIQAEFMHYPKQQQCVIDVLSQMEENGVIPDSDMETQLISIFGQYGYPLRRYWRMMYWMPKFKNLSPFPLPEPLPKDTFELARLAIERISGVDITNRVNVYQSADIKDSIDDTWIISAQSKTQKRLLGENKPEDPVFVEGAFTVWIKGNPINYFILRGNARPVSDDLVDTDDVSKISTSVFNFSPPIQQTYLKVVPSVHEQEDGVVYALCATGTSSKDSLLSWIRHLERDGNPVLINLSVVFTLKSGTSEIANVEDGTKEKVADK